MATVSDTSPISNLSYIGRLDLLRSQFGGVWIPGAVRFELDRMSNRTAKALIEGAIMDGWIRCRTVTDWRFAAVLQSGLDRGESEAIALAVEAVATTLLIDEKDGRNAARRAGLNTLGVLGVLIRAKEMGEIARVKPEIAALRVHAGFFVGAALESAVLMNAGEGWESSIGPGSVRTSTLRQSTGFSGCGGFLNA